MKTASRFAALVLFLGCTLAWISNAPKVLAEDQMPAAPNENSLDWKALLESLPGVNLVALDAGLPLDLNLDGKTARYLLEALLASQPSSGSGGLDEGLKTKIKDTLMQEVLPHLRKLRLKGTRQALMATATFNEAPLQINFVPEKEAKLFSLYGLVVPRYLRLKISYSGKKLSVENLEEKEQSIALKLKIPVLSDEIYLHRLSATPADGSVYAEAGILGDQVTVFAKAKLYEKKFDGVDYWSTFIRNYRLLLFPFWEATWSLFE